MEQQDPLDKPVKGELLLPTGVFVDVETKIVEYGLYPSQYINELREKGKQKKFTSLAEKQTYLETLDAEIERKKKKLSIGFYRRSDTLERFKTSSRSEGKTIFIWKQPKTLVIIPDLREIDLDGYTSYSAFLNYSSGLSIEAYKVFNSVKWKPAFVNKDGFVAGNNLKIGEKKIEASVTINVPSPWAFLDDDIDKTIYKTSALKRMGAEAKLIILGRKKDVTDDTLPTPSEPSGMLDQSFDEKESVILKNCRYLKIKPRRVKGRPGQTIQMDQVFKVIAVMEDLTEHDVTGNPDLIWKPAPTYTFPQESSFNKRVEIKAEYLTCTATARIDVEYPFWSAPISDADDLQAKSGAPPADAYVWYVVCDKQYYDVVYTKHVDLTRHIVIAGPFPGPREPAMWIEDNCPRAKCNKAGGCSQNTAVRGGPWGVYCNRKSGFIVVTKEPQIDHHKLEGNFQSLTEGQLWIDQYYPSGLCDNNGGYVEDGFSELSSNVGKSKNNTKEKSQFAEIGGESARKILRESSEATRMSHGGRKGFSLHNFDNNLDNIMGKGFREKRAAQKKEAQEFSNEFLARTANDFSEYQKKNVTPKQPSATSETLPDLNKNIYKKFYPGTYEKWLKRNTQPGSGEEGQGTEGELDSSTDSIELLNTGVIDEDKGIFYTRSGNSDSSPDSGSGNNTGNWSYDTRGLKNLKVWGAIHYINETGPNAYVIRKYYEAPLKSKPYSIIFGPNTFIACREWLFKKGCWK